MRLKQIERHLPGRAGAALVAGSAAPPISACFVSFTFFEFPKPKSSSSSSYEELISRLITDGLGVAEYDGLSIKEIKPEEEVDSGTSSTCTNVFIVGVGAVESAPYEEPPHQVAVWVVLSSSVVVSNEGFADTVSFEYMDTCPFGAYPFVACPNDGA